MGESERTIENEGDVPALVADSIPSTISSDASLPPPNEPIVRSDRPPNSAVLARKSIDAMERMYLEGGWSLSEIGNFFHLSKSTVHGYLAHLISDPEARTKHEARRQQFHPASNADGGKLDLNATQLGPNGEQSYPNAAQSARSDTIPSQPRNEDGSNGSYSPQIPRINSEVVSVRPRVIENNNGYESTNSAGDNDGTTVQTQSSPLDMDLLRILSRDPRWVDVYLAIRAGARQAGVADPVVYFNENMWQDSRDMELVRALVPYDPERPESLMENLETIARKANTLDEATKRSGWPVTSQNSKGVAP